MVVTVVASVLHELHCCPDDSSTRTLLQYDVTHRHFFQEGWCYVVVPDYVVVRPAEPATHTHLNPLVKKHVV
jgi:hypothetical protein